jgi:hypothetical protein
MAYKIVRSASADRQAATTVPERFEYEAPWTTKDPDGAEVEVQLWATRDRDEGAVRICQGLVLGIVAAEETTVYPEDVAVDHYGTDWVMEQLHYGQKLLGFRAGRS